jgi:hypothetical protein
MKKLVYPYLVWSCQIYAMNTLTEKLAGISLASSGGNNVSSATPSLQALQTPAAKPMSQATFDALSELIRQDRADDLAQFLTENPTTPLDAPDPKLSCAELTLLDTAIYQGKDRCARVLLDKKANPQKALENAIYWAQPGIVRLLLEYGAKPQIPCINHPQFEKPLPPLAYAHFLAKAKTPRPLRCTPKILREIITLLNGAVVPPK